jgi:hypothetical protein
MEQVNIPQDIKVVFLKAENFPADVPDTYKKLHALIGEHPDRRYFGISHPDQTGKIQYKAAAEILPSDYFSNNELSRFTIEKGVFSSRYINNHFQDNNCIGDTFNELLRHPQLDPAGYCLEVYKNYTDPDVHCMVRLMSSG